MKIIDLKKDMIQNEYIMKNGKNMIISKVIHIK